VTRKKGEKFRLLLFSNTNFVKSKRKTMAVLNIYNDIQSEQDKAVTRMWGMEPGISFRDINEFCDSLPADDKAIDVHIHCNGGDVLEGWAIYDRLRATGKEITTIVDGTDASMATVIMMAAPKERRKAYANAQILVHNPWLDPAWVGSNGMATADDLEKAAANLKEQQDRILDLYVERCGCDREEMAALMAEDKFISVERAMELGMVGEIIAPISAKSVNHMSIKDKIINAIKSVFDNDTEGGPRMMAMELATASGDTLRIEREEGAPAVGDVAEPDGEWLMPDNTTIVVENGVITEIRQPEEEAEVVDEGGEQEGDATAEETDGEQSELEKENEALKERIAELEQQLAELTERLAEANANAKTTEDLRILNMVTMGGGYEKVAASIKSNYTPEKREPVTSKAEEAVQRNYLKERIEAAKNKKNK
jgi:ATP-dependent Clp protease protease subunit